jgi:hypothetical protein
MTCNEFVGALDRWVGQSVAIRLTAEGPVLLAVFHGVLRERSDEKRPALFWPLVPPSRASTPITARIRGSTSIPTRSRRRPCTSANRPSASSARGDSQPSPALGLWSRTRQVGAQGRSCHRSLRVRPAVQCVPGAHAETRRAREPDATMPRVPHRHTGRSTAVRLLHRRGGPGHGSSRDGAACLVPEPRGGA